GKNLPVAEVQSRARAYALEQIDRQRADFQRLGILGNWDDPYLTMNFSNEANELRALARIMKKGFVFRGLKPVNWCFDCRSALAEAEVEYMNRRDNSIHVAFPFADPKAMARAFGIEEAKPGVAVVWTTTPWTIPANQALNVHPEHDYALVELDTPLATGPRIMVADELVDSCLEQWGLSGQVVATTSGKKLELLACRHPLAQAHSQYDRQAPIYLADYVTLDSGTGIVHSSPAYGVEDFLSCRQHGLADEDIINPVLGD